MTRLRAAVRRLAPALLLVSLGACAYAPGLYLGNVPAERTAAEREAAAITPVAIDWALIRRFDAVARKPSPQLPNGEPGAYRIGPNDALRITVWNHPDLNFAPNLSVTTLTTTNGSTGAASNVVPQRVVQHDGSIYFPMAGRIEAAGRTLPELRSQIARQLSRFVKDPQVEVELAAFRSQRVFVVGEVQTPGNLSITDVPMRIADAIGQAGGVTTNANLSTVTVTRGAQRLVVDLDRLYYEGEMAQNLLLRHGDVVTVPDRRESKIFVLGEVAQPKSYPLPRGRIDLADAVSDAGGPNPLSSNAGQVFVVRLAENDEPLLYHLDARSPEAMLLADRFVLRPRDVVYVDPTQLARAGRVIAQLLPWLQSANQTAGIGR